MKIFYQVIASVGSCLTQNFWVIVTTQISFRLTSTQGLVHILILCESSGWGLMESWELYKILTVSWEITCFFYW